jgi:thymidylate synthase
MNNLDKQYQALLQDILDNGVQKEDRTGTGTLSVFGRQIRHKMSEGFPLLTTKKMYFKGVVTELLWFLRGDTSIEYLLKNDCHIWDGDAYKNYEKAYKKDNSIGLSLLVARVDGKTTYRKPTKEQFIAMIEADPEFAKKWGELGPIYGKMWRDWDADTGEKIDQIQNLINDLKKNPDSRRLMVNAWNCTYIPHMVLPPCHYGFQVYTRELSFSARYRLGKYQPYSIEGKVEYEEGLDYITQEQFESFHNKEMDKLNIPTRAISLMWNQRSVDTFLGLPFNIASYGLLLEIIAKEVNMVPDELIGNLGDTHLYLNHIEQAKEQIGRLYTLEERVALIPEGELSEEAVEHFKANKSLNDEIIKALGRHNISPGLHTRKPYPLPKLRIKYITDNQMIYPKLIPTTGEEEEYEISDFILEDYKSHPAIKAPLSN